MFINTLPIKSRFKNDLDEKFLNTYSVEQMRGEEGLELVKIFLDEELGDK